VLACVGFINLVSSTSFHGVAISIYMPGFALKILIVEDNDDIREGWMRYFQSRGHYVRGVGLAESLIDESSAFTPDIYVIDLNLPDADGLDLVENLRKVHPNKGLVITTARSKLGDKLVGYESGADLYFTKPIEPAELMAGIISLAARLRPKTTDEKALHFRCDLNVLVGPAGSVELSPNESIMLTGLVRAAGQPLSRWQLAEMIGSGDALPSDASMEMRIARLRKKVAAAGADQTSIKAIYGRGYHLSGTIVLD
jgi:DNA-binding response OmpR family regulator